MKRTLCKYIGILFSLCCLCGATFAGLRPCGAGYTAALLYGGMPAVVVLPAYLAFSLLFDFSLSSAVYALSVCVASFAAALLSLRFRKAKRLLFTLFTAAAQTALLLKHSQIGYLLMPVWGILSLGVFVASVCFLHPVLVKRCKFKFLETELACGGVLLICAALGHVS